MKATALDKQEKHTELALSKEVTSTWSAQWQRFVDEGAQSSALHPSWTDTETTFKHPFEESITPHSSSTRQVWTIMLPLQQFVLI